MDVAQPGRGLNRDLAPRVAPGEAAECQIDAFIEKRHQSRIRDEGERLEEAFWRAGERRAQEKQRQEEHAGRLVNERHLRSVYFRLYKEKAGSVAKLEERAPKGMIMQVQTRVSGGRSVMEVAHGEMVEAELNRLIEKRSSREMDPDECEELCQESARTYNARGREENCLAWCEYHHEPGTGRAPQDRREAPG